MLAHDLALFGRIAVAAGLGFAVGWEREVRGHPAGSRTFALVASGSRHATSLGVSGASSRHPDVGVGETPTAVVVGPCSSDVLDIGVTVAVGSDLDVVVTDTAPLVESDRLVDVVGAGSTDTRVVDRADVDSFGSVEGTTVVRTAVGAGVDTVDGPGDGTAVDDGRRNR